MQLILKKFIFFLDIWLMLRHLRLTKKVLPTIRFVWFTIHFLCIIFSSSSPQQFINKICKNFQSVTSSVYFATIKILWAVSAKLDFGGRLLQCCTDIHQTVMNVRIISAMKAVPLPIKCTRLHTFCRCGSFFLSFLSELFRFDFLGWRVKRIPYQLDNN